jgi:hypothetical protein
LPAVGSEFACTTTLVTVPNGTTEAIGACAISATSAGVAARAIMTNSSMS